jgi:hypothetical protein
VRRLREAREQLAVLAAAEDVPAEPSTGLLRGFVHDLRWYRRRAPRALARAFPDLKKV